MKQFSLEKWLQNNIRKVVTTCDGEVYGDKELKPIVKEIAEEPLDLARKELQPEFDRKMDKMLAETDKVVYQKGRCLERFAEVEEKYIANTR